ncbi:jmjC domain-containing protein 8 isoform X2 [Narcine bancroftii]|uniref:jmjC domain-containing protein 8 isoform X2 n=1 Tax=Narcine bancroftii TaxID=1343680 RepID=UPI003831402D
MCDREHLREPYQINILHAERDFDTIIGGYCKMDLASHLHPETRPNVCSLTRKRHSRHMDHSMQMVGKGLCNVEVRDSLTYSEFVHRYAYSKPVVIRGLSRNEKFRALCSKQRLLQEFGDRLVRLSTANTYSYQKVDVLFKDYIQHIMKPQSLDSLGSDTLYFFGDNNFTEWDSLFRTYIPPPFQLPGTKEAYSFGIAGAGTGVPFHWHGPGYSEIIYGRKHWLLYPPDKTPEFHPNRTTLSWILDTYPYLSEEDKPLECTIHPGEDEEKSNNLSKLLL